MPDFERFTEAAHRESKHSVQCNSMPLDGGVPHWTTASWLQNQGGTSNVLAQALLQPLLPSLEGRGVHPMLELCYIKAIGEAGSRDDVLALLQQSSEGVLNLLADSVWSSIEMLVKDRLTTNVGMHEKFVANAIELQYGGLSTFFGGLEGLIGAPSSNLMATLEAEHCGSKDSSIIFITANYRVRTTSKMEWHFVVVGQPPADADGQLTAGQVRRGHG